MPTLKKIGEKQIERLVSSADFEQLNKSGEPVFYVEIKKHIPAETDPLVDVEIALRRGERVGLFSPENVERPRS